MVSDHSLILSTLFSAVSEMILSDSDDSEQCWDQCVSPFKSVELCSYASESYLSLINDAADLSREQYFLNETIISISSRTS